MRIETVQIEKKKSRGDKMITSGRLAELVEIISGETKLEPSQKEQFKGLVNAYMMNDEPLLPELDRHEESYDVLLQRADNRVKVALRIYVKRRKNYLD